MNSKEGNSRNKGEIIERKKGLVRAFYKFKNKKMAVIGLIIIILEIIVAIFAPFIAPYPEDAGMNTNFAKVRLSPNFEHLFGTDSVGRDLFTRVIYGTRISLTIVFLVLSLSVFMGTALGITAGYFGGIIEQIIMRVNDVFLAIPPLVFALALTGVLEPSIWTIMIAISFVWWRSYCRMAYGETLSVKQEDFIVASQVMDASHSYIIFKDILPNIYSTLLVQMSLEAGYVILTAASLSFLGVGAQPPTPEWGVLISSGRDYLPGSWWLCVFPGLAIFITVISFNFLGDGIRDYFEDVN